MRFRIIACAVLALATAGAAAPAFAEVHDASDAGFAVRSTVLVPASAEEAWNELLDPADWWDSAHTFSGDAANLSLDARAGGCFCEVLPAEDKLAPPRGGVQHLQVVYIEKPRVLRMVGALGPLQSEPVNGVLTFVLKAEEGGTRINAEYIVGGYLRPAIAKIAPVVDRVIAAQVSRLGVKLGAAPAPASDEAPVEAAPAGDSAAPPADSPPAVDPQPEAAPLPTDGATSAPTARAPIVGR